MCFLYVIPAFDSYQYLKNASRNQLILVYNDDHYHVINLPTNDFFPISQDDCIMFLYRMLLVKNYDQYQKNK